MHNHTSRLSALVLLSLLSVGCRDVPATDVEAQPDATTEPPDAGEPADGGSATDAGESGVCRPWTEPSPAGFTATCSDSQVPRGSIPEAEEDVPPDALGVRQVRNLHFGTRGAIALQGDLYLPPGIDVNKPPGTLVVVHGGGWASCERRSSAAAMYAYGMALFGGFATFNVEYRVVSEGGAFPENVSDVKCAIQWLKHVGARRFPIDPSRVAIAGESAGAHLALLVGLTHNRNDLDPGCAPVASSVVAVAAYSAPTDLPALAAGSPDLREMVNATAGPCQVAVEGCSVGRACQRCVDASPVTHACDANVPFVLVHAPDPWDLLVPFSQAAQLRDRLVAAGATVALVVPTPAELRAGGCEPVTDKFAHGWMPCMTEATGEKVLQVLQPLLAP